MLPKALPHRGSTTPLAGLRALDVGCGGGLLSEVRFSGFPPVYTFVAERRQCACSDGIVEAFVDAVLVL